MCWAKFEEMILRQDHSKINIIMKVDKAFSLLEYFFFQIKKLRL